MTADTQDDFDLGRTMAWILFGILATGIAFAIFYFGTPEPVQAESETKANYALQEVPDEVTEEVPPWRQSTKAPDEAKIQITADLR